MVQLATFVRLNHHAIRSADDLANAERSCYREKYSTPCRANVNRDSRTEYGFAKTWI